ncbi:uncharacterized protein [Eleutherodactylus coqui]|uniref:uncharacterized protein isoform X3 n=1 Tax=Eleutherodactylus coqui TaxID=57060 RepID=UPI00346372C0
MTQHRMMTILLIVCLSLCFEVLQSRLLKNEDPCIYSDDCESRCCHRNSPNGSGKCATKSFPDVRCYGPNESNRCFYSHQCHSGCCFPMGTVKDATCVHKYPASRKCYGPDGGDYCALSENCKSGCCVNIHMDAGVCIQKAKENEECDPETHNGFYKHYCPCESGLICEKDTICVHSIDEIFIELCGIEFIYRKPEVIVMPCRDQNRRICKKPSTANKWN